MPKGLLTFYLTYRLTSYPILPSGVLSDISAGMPSDILSYLIWHPFWRLLWHSFWRLMTFILALLLTSAIWHSNEERRQPNNPHLGGKKNKHTNYIKLYIPFLPEKRTTTFPVPTVLVKIGTWLYNSSMKILTLRWLLATLGFTKLLSIARDLHSLLASPEAERWGSWLVHFSWGFWWGMWIWTCTWWIKLTQPSMQSIKSYWV